MPRVCCLFALALVLALPRPTAAQDDEPLELRLAYQAPADSHLGENLAVFREQVEANSETGVEIKLLPGGSLFLDEQIPEAVANNDVEMGVSALARYAEDIPLADFYYLPFRGKSPEDLARLRAPESPVRQAIDEAILSLGLRVLWWQSYGRVLVLSPRSPAKTPISIEGSKVRVFGPRGAELVEVVGGAAARMPAPELPGAFASFSLDHAMIDAATLGRLELWDHAQVVTVASFGSIEMPVVISEQVWASLGEDLREIIEAAAADAQKDADTRIAALEQEVLSDAASHGLVVHRYGMEEYDAWESSVEELVRRFEERSGEAGTALLEAVAGYLSEEAN